MCWNHLCWGQCGATCVGDSVELPVLRTVWSYPCWGPCVATCVWDSVELSVCDGEGDDENVGEDDRQEEQGLEGEGQRGYGKGACSVNITHTRGCGSIHFLLLIIIIRFSF